jgi:hypothetical protein
MIIKKNDITYYDVTNLIAYRILDSRIEISKLGNLISIPNDCDGYQDLIKHLTNGVSHEPKEPTRKAAQKTINNEPLKRTTSETKTKKASTKAKTRPSRDTKDNKSDK